MKNHCLFYLAMAILLLANVSDMLHAQKPRLYSIEHGLASTQLTDLQIDKDNFLWVSTRGGLSRFDGQNFTTFTGDVVNPFMLNTNHVSCSFVDKEGKIWIGANDGLYYFDHFTNSFTHFPLEEAADRTVSVSCITSIDEHPNDLLIGTNGYGLYVFDKTKMAVDQPLTTAYNDVLGISYITHMINDDLGMHWIFTHHWFTILNPKGMKLMKPVTSISEEEQEQIEIQSMSLGPTSRILYLGTVNHGILMCHTRSFEVEKLDIPELNHRQITAIAPGQDTCMLVGTEGQGFWQLNVRDRVAERLHYPLCPVDLDHAKIKNIAHDKQNNTWLNLYQKGIMVIPTSGKLFSCQPILADKSSEHNLSNVSCFCQTADGTRYYGLDGAGVLIARPDGSRTLNSVDNSILQTNAIMCLQPMPNGNIYVGTYGYGMYVIDKNGKVTRDPRLAELDIRSIMCMTLSPNKKTLYIGSNGEGVFTYDLASGELENIVNDAGSRWIVSLYAENDDQIWFGTEGLLMRYNVPTHDVTRFKEPQHVRIFSMAKDKNGTLWFLADQGLFLYYAKDQTIHAIKTGEQMGENYSAMLIDDAGMIWLSSNHGITCYDPSRVKSLRYNSPDIAEVGSFSIRAAQRWANGELGFGGDNGMLVFEPENVKRFEYTLSSVYFTRLWVNNQLTDYDPRLSAKENVLDSALWTASTLRLPISSNSFSLSFTVQEYSTPTDINYAYRLNGFEEEWHQVQGLNQTLSYAGLPAGTYTLVVSAHQGNDLNSQPQTKELKIIIYAPWYQNFWLQIVLAVIFVFSLIWMVVSMHQMLRRKKSKASSQS